MPPKKSLSDSLPRHLNDGFVPAGPEQFTDLALLPGQFRFFAAEVKQSLEILAGKVLPLLNEIRDIVREHSTTLGVHDKELASHGRELASHRSKLAEHDKLHGHHAEEITGVLKRLVVVEETIVTKRKPRKRK